MSGSNTFNTISSTKTVAHNIQFSGAVTTTVTDFTVSGTAGNVVGIVGQAGIATLTKVSGGTITLDYVSLATITGSPSSTWYATNSTQGANVSGFTFSSPPAPGTGKNLFFGSNF
jgi:hypothetical protein